MFNKSDDGNNRVIVLFFPLRGLEWKLAGEPWKPVWIWIWIWRCEYDYPFGHIVTSVSWFKSQFVSEGWSLTPISDLSSRPGHFKYLGSYHGDCRLQVNDVQPSDEGRYVFRFVTTLSWWRSSEYAFLTVKGNETKTNKQMFRPAWKKMM